MKVKLSLGAQVIQYLADPHLSTKPWVQPPGIDDIKCDSSLLQPQHQEVDAGGAAFQGLLHLEKERLQVQLEKEGLQVQLDLQVTLYPKEAAAIKREERRCRRRKRKNRKRRKNRNEEGTTKLKIGKKTSLHYLFCEPFLNLCFNYGKYSWLSFRGKECV